MTTHLYLVRHGVPDEAQADAGRLLLDPPLSEEGRELAGIVAERLARSQVDRIYASPLRRAFETAQPLAQKLGLEVTILDGLAEADAYAKTRTYLKMETLRRDPTAFSAFLHDPIGFLGADPEVFLAAVRGAMAKILADTGPGRRAAVFTHGIPINVVLADLLGLSRFVHFAPDYCSVTWVRGGPDGLAQVVSINDTGHLPRWRD
ncbi:MAG TPA: histidine phosphatase family protein [Polyangiaceae bacterium LLY-WYZ-14_1]|jgi:probable phosphoglycerate mutase|nr:histidine phosphatase family protein [Polyangiaceae bacterium LLY-WYZ-14_1]